MLDWYRAFWRFRARRSDLTVRQPTLILWGGRDAVVPTADAARFQAEIAGSRLVLFPDLGHMPYEEDPAATAAPVAAFLATMPAEA